MTTREFLLFAPLFLAALTSCCFVPRMWRGEMLGRDIVPSEWDVLASWVRAVPVGCPLGLGFFAVYGVATILSPEGGVVPTWYAAVILVYTTITLVIFAGIIALNVPKRLVPPERRRGGAVLQRAPAALEGTPAAVTTARTSP